MQAKTAAGSCGYLCFPSYLAVVVSVPSPNLPSSPLSSDYSPAISQPLLSQSSLTPTQSQHHLPKAPRTHQVLSLSLLPLSLKPLGWGCGQLAALVPQPPEPPSPSNTQKGGWGGGGNQLAIAQGNARFFGHVFTCFFFLKNILLLAHKSIWKDEIYSFFPITDFEVPSQS